MRVLGMLTAAVLVAAAAVGAVLGVRSIPDLKRYIKIRQM
jgi:hypothetical protein